MDWLLALSAVIRTINMIVWIYVVLASIRRGYLSPLARRLSGTVIVALVAVVAMGGFVPYGFPPDVARFLTTAVASYSLIIGLAIATTMDE